LRDDRGDERVGGFGALEEDPGEDRTGQQRVLVGRDLDA
jgi:hypothetical protein